MTLGRGRRPATQTPVMGLAADLAATLRVTDRMAELHSKERRRQLGRVFYTDRRVWWPVAAGAAQGDERDAALLAALWVLRPVGFELPVFDKLVGADDEPHEVGAAGDRLGDLERLATRPVPSATEAEVPPPTRANDDAPFIATTALLITDHRER